jgi:hypothetical protein
MTNFSLVTMRWSLVNTFLVVVKPLRPALVFIISTRWLTVLLELCCLEEEEEEEVFHLPILRVQAPLYRRGPGYRVSSGYPAACFPVAAALAWVPLSFVPLLGCRLLYKVSFPLDRHIRGICPSLPRILSWRGGLLGAVGRGRAWLASLRFPASAAPVGPLQHLIKRWLKVLSSSSAWAFGGENLSRLLAQPALQLKPASSAGCRDDPWDVSR